MRQTCALPAEVAGPGARSDIERASVGSRLPTGRRDP